MNPQQNEHPDPVRVPAQRLDEETVTTGTMPEAGAVEQEATPGANNGNGEDDAADGELARRWRFIPTPARTFCQRK